MIPGFLKAQISVKFLRRGRNPDSVNQIQPRVRHIHPY